MYMAQETQAAPMQYKRTSAPSDCGEGIETHFIDIE